MMPPPVLLRLAQCPTGRLAVVVLEEQVVGVAKGAGRVARSPLVLQVAVRGRRGTRQVLGLL